MKLKIGISSCLLGEPVRYNGEHKYSALCVEELSELFDFVGLCPEVGMGLGVPRSPIRLVLRNEGADLVQCHNEDGMKASSLSGGLNEYVQNQKTRLSELDGYIFMRKSPSCGLHEVKMYQSSGELLHQTARGAFAEAVCTAFPTMPVEEVNRLKQAEVKDAFIAQVRRYAKGKK